MTTREINNLIEEGESLRQIAQAYSDIANLKIKRIRSAVERNRLFFDEISRIYSTVKAFAIKKKVAVVKPKQKLGILVTSNNRFYGNINSSLVKYFIGLTRELKDTDRIVIGKEGIHYFKANKVLPNYQELLLKNDMPDNLELANLVNIISQYNQVMVFHPKFKSLLIQQATFTDITKISFYIGEFHVKEVNPKNKEANINFLFEPDLPKILEFFDSQVLTLLLEQTFLEAELSRTASRFISMDEAETDANKFIKEYQILRAYAKRNLDNNAILENFASMAALRKVNI